MMDMVLRKKEGVAMERMKNIIWLLIAFMLEVIVGLYWGGMTVKQQFQEVQAMREQFLIERFSQ